MPSQFFGRAALGRVVACVAIAAGATAMLTFPSLAEPPAGKPDAAKQEGKSAGGKQAEAAASPVFERIKKLAGEWEMKDESGKMVTALTSRVTSAGSVFAETMFPGSEHEMTNMYHMDGDSVIVTHYCAMGNQPRMRCKAVGEDGSLEFTFVDVTNRKSPQQPYMGYLKISFPDENSMVQEWKHLVEGKEGGKVLFELSRKAKG